MEVIKAILDKARQCGVDGLACKPMGVCFSARNRLPACHGCALTLEERLLLEREEGTVTKILKGRPNK